MNARLRPLVARDRDTIARILADTGNFTADEIATALQLIDEWLDQGESSDYLTYVLEDDDAPGQTSGKQNTGDVRGYVCFGLAPLTEGTFDLYWIAVDPKYHGQGYGQRLLRFAEEEAFRRGGRLMLIETSSQEAYGATIRFYERAGYELLARLVEYYRQGDDKLIFGVRLPRSVDPLSALRRE